MYDNLYTYHNIYSCGFQFCIRFQNFNVCVNLKIKMTFKTVDTMTKTYMRGVKQTAFINAVSTNTQNSTILILFTKYIYLF